jgi:hypothetical protein
MSKLEISSESIAKLDDSQLRTLVAKLCEAELHLEALSSSHVTWGGNQNASDGGIDVRVEVDAALVKRRGYVARASTGFQVKRENMPRRKISEEMSPGGDLRRAIVELIEEGGSYVIVSSLGDLSHKMRQDRLAAMREQVKLADPKGKLHVDFYDRQRLASWVSEHPALGAWVRRTIGEEMHGWQPYGAWSRESTDTEEQYVVDEAARLLDLRGGKAATLSISDGIAGMRQVLLLPAGVVRLVGLSGLGKTRLVQALFDDRIEAGQAPSPTLVHYTDVAHSPQPSPLDLMNHLEASRKRGILVVDNCPPEVHEQLAKRCKQCSHLSLITVEYDVRDQSLEGNDVFLLEPASDEALRKVLRARFKSLDAASVHRICEVAGGNARFASALAESVKEGESLIGVESGAMFERLFHQRERANEDILTAAETCSLLVSFDTDGAPDESAELQALAILSGLSAPRLYRCVGELHNRRLIQARLTWRAVLPQALAGWLAVKAIKRIPPASLRTKLFDEAPKRTQLSFARRLGDLHEAAEVQTLVRTWMAPAGVLCDPLSLDEHGRHLFATVAPVDPELALQTIERSWNNTTDREALRYFSGSWLTLLNSLAYEEALFDRAVSLMIALICDSRIGTDEERSLTDLFQVCLSGTHASLEARKALVARTIEASDERVRKVGVKLLGAMIRVECRGHSFPRFGSRRRNFGYWPETRTGFTSWYEGSIDLLGQAATESLVQDAAADLLAKRFRNLWTSTINCEDALIRAADSVASARPWFSGWIAIRNTLSSRTLARKGTDVSKLERLEKRLRPTDTLSLLQAHLTSERGGAVDIAGDFDTFGVDGHEAAQTSTAAQAQELSEEVTRAGLEEQLIPAVVRRENSWTDSIARGIYKGCDDKTLTWERLLSAYAAIDVQERSTLGLAEYLKECRASNPTLCEELLDNSMLDPRMGDSFPELQVLAASDSERSAKRLIESAERRMSASSFYFAWRVPMPAGTFAALLNRISALPGGASIALENLNMRTFNQRKPGAAAVEVELIECGRELLCSCPLDGSEGRSDHLIYVVGELIRLCLSGPDGSLAAGRFIAHLRSKTSDGMPSFLISEIVPALIEVQPELVLDAFFDSITDDVVVLQAEEPSIRDSLRLLDRVPTQVLDSWISEKPDQRACDIVPYITCVTPVANGASWSEKFVSAVSRTPERVDAYKAAECQLIPSGFRGQVASTVSITKPLVQRLTKESDVPVAEWARGLIARMDQAVDEEQKRAARSAAHFE